MKKSYIATHDFFKSLDENVLSILLANVGVTSFGPGETLFQEGGTADQFFVISSGDIKVGNEVNGALINERMLQPGDVIGWSWLVAPYVWSTTAVSQSETRAFVFDGIQVLVECEEDPRVGYALFKRFAGLMGQRLAAVHDPGVGRERQPAIKHVINSIASMEDDPRNRERFLAI